jgi:hypothetical protein
MAGQLKRGLKAPAPSAKELTTRRPKARPELSRKVQALEPRNLVPSNHSETLRASHHRAIETRKEPVRSTQADIRGTNSGGCKSRDLELVRILWNGDNMCLEKLLRIVTPVNEGEEGFHAWSEQSSFLDLLAEQRAGRSTILYSASFNHGSLFLHSIFVPIKDLDTVNPDEMMHWNDPHDSWSCGLVYGGDQPPRLEYDEPLSGISPGAFQGGQQLVFARSFDGRTVDKHYYEIAQSLTHAHNLHWTAERRAWCRFDENGDVEDVIKWDEKAGRSGFETATCIAIDREVIEMQMSATGTALVQMFDVASVGNGFHSWNKGEDSSVEDREFNLYFRSHREGANGSWLRGVQIIKPLLSSEGFGKYLYDKGRQPKQYASFITQDWKNKRVTEVSCAPNAIASYFESGSPLPFQISPVFFKAAVLDKYKADPEKYSLEHRSISCRNAWHLQSYDVNDAGQVHTYICYLGDLPHSEQLYWRSFNEEPKGPISKRAFTTDFEGEWYKGPDPLRDLQAILTDLHTSGVRWFTLREPNLVGQVHYPLTASVKAWSDTLIVLCKLVVEGLEKKYFEKHAESKGAKGDPNWGSINWVQEAMKAFGTPDEIIDEVTAPLRTVQQLRTKLAAHSGGSEANAIRADLLRKHKPPRLHIEYLCDQLVQSLRVLRNLDWR